MDNSNSIDEEIEKNNTRCVMIALATRKTGASENDLLKYFATSSDQEQDVRKEIQRVLNAGLMNGFLVKKSSEYRLPNRAQEFDVDGDEEDSESDLELM